MHVTASLRLEWRAFEEYCTEYGTLPTLDQLRSWALQQMVDSNDLDEMLQIRNISSLFDKTIRCTKSSVS